MSEFAPAKKTLSDVGRLSPHSLAAGPKGAQAIRQSFTELWYLLRIEFANVRESWIWSVIMISLFPLICVLFLKFFMSNPSEATMARVITGNMVFPIILMGMNTFAIEISLAKHNGHFVFYASLPISKLNFLISKFTAGFLMTLPSVFIMTLLGQWVFGVSLHFSIAVIPVLILAIGACVGFGMLIGFLSPNHQMTNIGSQMLMMIVSFLSPIMVPMEQLPKVMQYFSYLLPSTYAADSFHKLFTTGWESSVGTDLLILLGFFLLSIFLVMWKMDWRVER